VHTGFALMIGGSLIDVVRAALRVVVGDAGHPLGGIVGHDASRSELLQMASQRRPVVP
jgi:hypothetical protein